MNTAMRLLSRLGGLREEEPSPEKAGGGGGSDSNDNNNNPAPELDYDKLAAAIVKQQKASASGEDDDIYDKTKKRQKEQEEGRQQVEKIKAVVKFDSNFNSILEENESLFSMKPQEIRDGAKNLEDEELVEALKRTAAKDFFSNEENLKFLDEDEQTFVKDEIVRLTEKHIDAEKAWSLVEKCLLINKRINQHSGLKGAGNNVTTKAPKLDEFWNNLNKPKTVKAE